LIESRWSLFIEILLKSCNSFALSLRIRVIAVLFPWSRKECEAIVFSQFLVGLYILLPKLNSPCQCQRKSTFCETRKSTLAKTICVKGLLVFLHHIPEPIVLIGSSMFFLGIQMVYHSQVIKKPKLLIGSSMFFLGIQLVLDILFTFLFNPF
jgi:hypothetical protein